MPLPVLNPRSTSTGILCTWQLLRSNGAQVTAFRVQRRRLRGLPHPDASESSDSGRESDDSDDDVVVGGARARRLAAQRGAVSGSAHKGSDTSTANGGKRVRGDKWKVVVTDADATGGVLCFRGEDCPVTAENRAMEHLVQVTHGTCGLFCAYWIQDCQPGTQHYVRVQVRNRVGWSPPTDVICTARTHGTCVRVCCVCVCLLACMRGERVASAGDGAYVTDVPAVLRRCEPCSCGPGGAAFSCAVPDVVVHREPHGAAAARQRRSRHAVRCASAACSSGFEAKAAWQVAAQAFCKWFCGRHG